MSGSGGAGRGTFDLYLRDVAARPVPTREEERRLARRVRSGDREAFDDLVVRNLRFVVAVARHYRGRGLSLPELVEAGNEGLIRAAGRFDADRGVRFVTYAGWWIRQAILEALEREARTRPRTAGETGGASLLSLDLPAGDSPAGPPLAECLPDPAAERPDATADRKALREAVRRCVASLPSREAEALRLYFGLDGGGARSLEQVGRRLGVSRDRARQIRDRGLARLRSGSRASLLSGFRD